MSRIVLAENNKLLAALKNDFQKKLIFSMYTKNIKRDNEKNYKNSVISHSQYTIIGSRWYCNLSL
jgi:hypothetical protein